MPRRNKKALAHTKQHKAKCRCRYCRAKTFNDPAEVSSR